MPLESLDLVDNYVGELHQLRHLAKFVTLTELLFRVEGKESKGSNPICDIADYKMSAQITCGHLKMLDGQPASI